MIAIHPYREDQFDAGYYGGGARGGFPTYRYDTPEQRQELEYKWDSCQMGGDFRSILFVGCALGFEVKYFRSRGKSAFGVDISHYALEHSEQEAKPFVSLYNGWDLSREPECDAIAAFDVLTLCSQ